MYVAVFAFLKVGSLKRLIKVKCWSENKLYSVLRTAVGNLSS